MVEIILEKGAVSGTRNVRFADLPIGELFCIVGEASAVAVDGTVCRNVYKKIAATTFRTLLTGDCDEDYGYLVYPISKIVLYTD